MDPPSLPPDTDLLSPGHDNTTTTTTTTTTVAASIELPGLPKLRLLCSYGGHILPRPHDKTLTYIGGDTRLVVVDRQQSLCLSSLTSRLSKTLLNNRPFTLKYQLPHEDLDNLITISTDEDLHNMIEEYDRTANQRPTSRLRVFLFLSKPETAVSMGVLLNDAKSEDWFVDALNNLLPRGVSDSATDMERLLSIDEEEDRNVNNNNNNIEEGGGGGDKVEGKRSEISDQSVAVVDVVSVMPDSPLMGENSNSSYGSSSSSPSTTNLPPISVRMDQERRCGVEEQFAQLSAGGGVVSGELMGGGGGGGVQMMNVGRVVSDDERPDHGVPPAVAFRKPPLPSLQVQGVQPMQQRAAAAGYNLASPDSAASDSSIASASSFTRPTMYEDPTHVASKDTRVLVSPTPSDEISDPSNHVQMQQKVQESTYMLQPQLDLLQPQLDPQQQQQYHMSTHYISHPATNPVLIPSYYPVYPTHSQQQLHHQINQQHPVYVMPVAQTQPYSVSLQPNLTDATVLTSTRPPSSPSPALVPSANYKDATPPMYPTKTALKPEMAPNVYNSYMTPTPQLVQVPSNSNQYQQQHVGIPQVNHPPQSIPVASMAPTSYALDYSMHDQAYYTQHPPAPMPPQYQTMTQAAAMALSDASKQIPNDITKQQMIAPQQL